MIINFFKTREIPFPQAGKGEIRNLHDPTGKIYDNPAGVIPGFLILLTLIIFSLYPVIDEGAFVIGNLFPIIVAWFLGLKWGLVYASIHLFLMPMYGYFLGASMESFLANGLLAQVVTFGISTGVGGIREIIKKLNDELVKRHEAEAELKQYKDNLEKLVEKRTKELTLANERLQQVIIEREKAEDEKDKLEASLKRAEKMEAVGILAGSVAHDLNNILSGIINYPELLLLDLPQDSPLAEPLKIIQESGEKAAAVVQDLLTLARRGIVTTEPIDLNMVINNFLKSPEFHKLKSYYKNIEVEVLLDPELLFINGSPIHLSKVLMNLVLNSIEAMNRGGKVLLSSANVYIDHPVGNFELIPEGEYVILKVIDTGSGISKRDLERIFEPFYTRKIMGRSGTGLGMAIVWNTVKDHGGFIDLQSVEGKGTTFTLFFPVSRDKTKQKINHLKFDDLLGNGETILIVDDVKMQRDICMNILKKLGYTVHCVDSGEKAIEFLTKNSVDLLVLDMIMDNGIDGYETYKRILEINPAQKAIITSGYSETDLVRKAQKLGAGSYIKKPYKLEKIGQIVKTELNKIHLT